MAASFTLNYPSNVGTTWRFSVSLIGSDVVITGTVGNYVPSYLIFGF